MYLTSVYIVNIYCYNIFFEFIKLCSSLKRLSFLFKTFFVYSKKFTSKFICLSPLYKRVNCPRYPNTLTSLSFCRISKLYDRNYTLLFDFLKQLTCLHVFLPFSYYIVIGYGFLFRGSRIHSQNATRNVNLIAKVSGWIF